MYSRDASGDTLAVYDASYGERYPYGHPLEEMYIFGSNRIGVDKTFRSDDRNPGIFIYHKDLTSTHYEISNHLGNVLATVTGRKLGQVQNDVLDHYLPEVVTAQDYYAFGALMPGRSYENTALSGTNDYRYAFNGKELDKSGEWGSLNHYDYGFRIYNPAIAKFLSVDPLTASYPWYTPYQFAGNKPIAAIDLDGLEEKWVTFYQFKNESGFDLRKTEIKIDKDVQIYNQSQERVAVTHIRIINGSGDIVAEWDMHECVDECTGLMSNGFEPTAMYNLNVFDPKNEIQKAKEVNGADNYYWITDYLEITDGKTLEFNKHLNSSPEKIAELQDLDDVLTVVFLKSKNSNSNSETSLGVKNGGKTKNEKKINTKRKESWEQKEQEYIKGRDNATTKKDKAAWQKKIDHARNQQKKSENHSNKGKGS